MAKKNKINPEVSEAFENFNENMRDTLNAFNKNLGMSEKELKKITVKELPNLIGQLRDINAIKLANMDISHNREMKLEEERHHKELENSEERLKKLNEEGIKSVQLSKLLDEDRKRNKIEIIQFNDQISKLNKKKHSQEIAEIERKRTLLENNNKQKALDITKEFDKREKLRPERNDVMADMIIQREMYKELTDEITKRYATEKKLEQKKAINDLRTASLANRQSKLMTKKDDDDNKPGIMSKIGGGLLEGLGNGLSDVFGGKHAIITDMLSFGIKKSYGAITNKDNKKNDTKVSKLTKKNDNVDEYNNEQDDNTNTEEEPKEKSNKSNNTPNFFDKIKDIFNRKKEEKIVDEKKPKIEKDVENESNEIKIEKDVENESNEIRVEQPTLQTTISKKEKRFNDTNTAFQNIMNKKKSNPLLKKENNLEKIKLKELSKLTKNSKNQLDILNKTSKDTKNIKFGIEDLIKKTNSGSSGGSSGGGIPRVSPGLVGAVVKGAGLVAVTAFTVYQLHKLVKTHQEHQKVVEANDKQKDFRRKNGEKRDKELDDYGKTLGGNKNVTTKEKIEYEKQLKKYNTSVEINKLSEDHWYVPDNEKAKKAENESFIKLVEMRGEFNRRDISTVERKNITKKLEDTTKIAVKNIDVSKKITEEQKKINNNDTVNKKISDDKQLMKANEQLIATNNANNTPPQMLQRPGDGGGNNTDETQTVSILNKILNGIMDINEKTKDVDSTITS